MTNAHSKEFLKTIDEQIKRLRDEGKLDEANSLQLHISRLLEILNNIT
tara:strand:+ start:453 stop:596 length:144 start_codon:yes stop_codon:yes gene_type:complete